MAGKIVYIAEQSIQYEGETLLAVCSTARKAMNACERFATEMPDYGWVKQSDDWWERGDYRVYTVRIDDDIFAARTPTPPTESEVSE